MISNQIKSNMQLNREFWRNKRVLVTGHSGFKGGWLSAWLIDMGANVTGISLPPQTKPSFFEATDLGARMKSIFLDIRDGRELANQVVAANPEIVFHLAAQPIVIDSYSDPLGTYETNVTGTINLLEGIRKCPGVRASVIVTSDKCYENLNWAYGYREIDRLGGHDPYSNSKACTELVVSAYRHSFFNKKGQTVLASVRAGNVFGGGDWARYRLIPDCMRAYAAGQTMVVRNPSYTRPWQFVVEPLRGYLQVAQACYEWGTDFGMAFNFGPKDSDILHVEQVVKVFSTHLGVQPEQFAMAAKSNAETLHEAFVLKLDSSLAQEKLGWRQTVELPLGLKLTAEWYKAYYSNPDSAKMWSLTLSQLK